MLAIFVIVGLVGSDASVISSTGHSDETNIIGTYGDDCIGNLYMNHDGSFENAYRWQFEGCQPPYYGALAEVFDLGQDAINRTAMWLTQTGNFSGQPLDAYVWDGGIGSDPGAVIYFSQGNCGWFVATDEDGPSGYPWTNVAPGIGFPTGWQHAADIFGACQSFGFGVY